MGFSRLLRGLAVVLVACGGGSGGDDIDARAIDAGDDVDGMPIDADVSVTGTSMLTHYVRNGASVATMVAPEDLTAYTFAAYVRDESVATGFRIIAGTAMANGTLRIPDVPMGAYYLKVQRTGSAPVFYYTDDRALDLGYGTAGKPGLVDTTMTSAVNPTITGLDRAYSTDVFSLHSLGTGTEQARIDFGANPPVGPVTTLTASFDWMDGVSWALDRRPKLLANDDVEILHHREYATTSQQQTTRTTVLIERARVSGLTQTDGAALAVSGSFTDVTADTPVIINIPMGALRTAYAGAPHAIETVSAGIGRFAGGNPYNGFGATLTSHTVSNVKPTINAITGMTIYGNPYDATWAAVAYERYSRERRVRVPGVAPNQPANVITTQLVNNRPYTSGDLTGAVTTEPPTGLQVGATPATDGVRSFDGMAPVTLQWTAGANANRYSVAIHRLTAPASNQAPELVATGWTEGTSIVFPADLFVSGSRYVFIVSAVRDTVPYGTGTLRAGITPRYIAQTASGVILLSSTCGNGTMDAGEECDTAGQSATCDVDCSLPVCLDGIVNSAAQEQCDAGVRTGGCDGNCTVAMCGDGTVNPDAGEQCDDNNTDATDGCSPMCQWEDRCGDGLRQSLFGEQCDDGDMDNTDACTNACRTATCGDGFVYSGIEGCDDGNLVDGDTCSSTCVVTP